jgi:hypothetical protein
MVMFCSNCGNMSCVFPSFQLRKSNGFDVTEKGAELRRGKFELTTLLRVRYRPSL